MTDDTYKILVTLANIWFLGSIFALGTAIEWGEKMCGRDILLWVFMWPVLALFTLLSAYVRFFRGLQWK